MIPGGIQRVQWHEVGKETCIIEIFDKTMRQALLRNKHFVLYFEVVLVSVYQIYQIYSFYFQKRYIYLIANTSLIPKNVTFKVLRMQQK